MWGLVAVAAGGLALLAFGLPPAAPAPRPPVAPPAATAAAAMPATTEDAAALRAEILALDSTLQLLRTANNDLAGRVSDLMQQQHDVRGRLAAVETAVLRLADRPPVRETDATLTTGSVTGRPGGPALPGPAAAIPAVPGPAPADPAAAPRDGPGAAATAALIAPQPVLPASADPAPPEAALAETASAVATPPVATGAIATSSAGPFGLPDAPGSTNDGTAPRPARPGAAAPEPGDGAVLASLATPPLPRPYPASHNAGASAAAPLVAASPRRSAPPVATVTAPGPGGRPAGAAANVRAIGVAIGAPVRPAGAMAAWQQLASRVGVLLVGTSPRLADDPGGSGGKVLVAGPVASLAAATKLCADVGRAGLACTPMPYVGADLAAASR